VRENQDRVRVVRAVGLSFKRDGVALDESLTRFPAPSEPERATDDEFSLMDHALASALRLARSPPLCSVGDCLLTLRDTAGLACLPAFQNGSLSKFLRQYAFDRHR
jgi:hypothetical protein